MVAGMMPSFTSEKEKIVPFCAMAMSAAAARPQAPAMAAPCTSAMVTCGSSKQRRSISAMA